MRTHVSTTRRSALLTAVGVGLVVAAASWYVFLGTVQYSLSQLQRAITQRDRYLFERHVDLDHLTRRLLDDLLEVSSQEIQGQALNTWEELGAQLGIAFAQLLKPRFVDEVQQAVLRAVESGAIARGEITPARASPQDEVGHALMEFANALPKLKPLGSSIIRPEGRTSAVVELSVSPGAEAPPQTVQFRLVRTPERYWRATELVNLKELLLALHEFEEKRLEVANEPLRQRIRQAIQVVHVTKEQGLDESGTSKDAILAVTLQNLASKPIHGLTATATIRRANGLKLHETHFRDLSPIGIGETKERLWGLGLDVFDDADRELYAIDPSRLAFEVEVTELIFEDGTSLKLADSLKEAAALKTQLAQTAPPHSQVPTAQQANRPTEPPPQDEATVTRPPRKICPVGGEAYDASKQRCPFHGVDLQSETPQLANSL